MRRFLMDWKDVREVGNRRAESTCLIRVQCPSGQEADRRHVYGNYHVTLVSSAPGLGYFTESINRFRPFKFDAELMSRGELQMEVKADSSRLGETT